MNSRLRSARLARLSPLAGLLALAACSSVIGIEQLHEGPAPGSGGVAEAGGGGLDQPNGGTTADGGRAGRGQAGGSGGNGGSSGGSGNGGHGGGTPVGAAGAGSGAAGTNAGGDSSGSSTVTGHLIDYRGHKVAGAPVQIGDTLVTTDAQGAFTIHDVPAEYDVSLVVDFSGDYPRETYGWVFQGLTRRDPTLQVYSAISRHSANIVVQPKNAAPDSTHLLTVALGGPDGSSELKGVGANGVQTTTTWRGAPTTQEHAHALFWQEDATSSLPVSYLGYDTQLVALAGTTDVSMINLDLAATANIASGNIAGTITPASGSNRANGVYLRFTSGATIELAADSTGPNTFSYLVPTLPNAGVTLAAAEGDAYFGQFAVVHKDGLAAGNSAILAAIPTPSKPLTPIGGATGVGTNSPFTFVAGAGSAGTFVVSMIADDYYDGLYVVTTKKTFKVPVVVGGAYAFGATHTYSWRVETHGNLATVDAMAGPTGFMDEFSADDATPIGPRNTDGSFTISQSNGFTAQ